MHELNTVTYGINCAPYLALRRLQCTAEQKCAEFPFVREALLHHTYVDDICVGSDTIDEVKSLQKVLIHILHCAPIILAKVPLEDQTCEPLTFDDSFDNGTKMFRFQWYSRDNAFTYNFHSELHISTKCGMSSLIARLFDLLGLISSVTFLAKNMIQRV